MKNQNDSAPRANRESGRGRHADKPSEVPARGWLDILSRTKQQLAEDNLSIVAAGVAFYAFSAAVPALAAVVAIYALVSDPQRVSEQIASLGQIVPGEVMPLLEEQMTRLTSDNQTAGIGLAISLAIALYGSSRAIQAMIIGLNIAYGEREKRGFFKLKLVSLGLTLLAIVGAVLAIGLVAVLPSLLNFLPLSGDTSALLGWLRWPVLVLGFMIALAVLYRFAPSRNEPQWRWVTWGAGVGTLLWVLGSLAFSLYVGKFGSYDKTYGSLGAVVVFLMWLFLSAYAILVGAELNAEMERQTVKDTTDAPQEPMGQRGAVAADTVGPSREEKEKTKPSAKPQQIRG